MICPTCRTQVADNVKFCTRCGAELQPAAAPTAGPSAMPAPPAPAAHASAIKQSAAATPSQAGKKDMLAPLLRSGKIQDAQQFRHWETLLCDLADADTSLDAKRRKHFSWGCSLSVISLILCFVGVVLIGGNHSWAGILVVVAFVVLLPGAWNLVAYLNLKKFDLMNDFRYCLTPLLAWLSEDVDPKSKVQLTLDVKGNSKQKLVSKQKIPSSYIRLVETVYHDPWCALKMKLNDGSALSLNIENFNKCYTRTYRTARGKIKTKSKWKKVTIVAAQLDPNDKFVTWSDEKLNAGASEDTKLKAAQKAGGRVCRVERKYKFRPININDARPDEVVSPEDVMDLLVNLCSYLKPAKAQGQ
jgi:hypothetical protein